MNTVIHMAARLVAAGNPYLGSLGRAYAAADPFYKKNRNFDERATGTTGTNLPYLYDEKSIITALSSGLFPQLFCTVPISRRAQVPKFHILYDHVP